MARKTETLGQNIRNIISSSDLIRSGPPAVYQLRTKKEMFGSLTRITVGEKDEQKPNKTILLVGETGAGKSTLINALVNYSIGVQWKDGVWFQIVEEEKKSQTESQTSDVMVYQIFEFEGKTLPYSLTIIDTPGFGDTTGIKHDDIISQRLLDLFRSEHGVHEVHAVGLVMKAGDKRLSERLMYIFDAVFGQNMEENIVALFTHSDGMPPTDALKALEDRNIKCKKTEKNQFVHFVFNNQQSTQRTDENELGLENAWRVAERGLRQFTTFLQDAQPKKVEPRSAVQIECIRLVACIQNLRERIRFTELKQRDVREAQEALHDDGNDKQKMKNNKLYTVAEVYKDMEAIRSEKCRLGFGEAVCCNICKENCHYSGCTMALKPEECEVMRNGFCTSCSGRCPASGHVKAGWRYVIRTRAVEITDKTMKQKYEQKQGTDEAKLTLPEILYKEMKQLSAEKFQLVEEAYQHFMKLDQIAKNISSPSSYVHLDFLMKKMKEKGDKSKLQDLEDIDRQMDAKTRSAVQDRMRFISSAHEDIISSSVLIRSGSPAVCQLRTKKEKFGSLTRKTVGEKDPQKNNKTILLVGETGAGKSALINALVNYSMGVEWEDGVWFKIVEEKKKSQSKSQTKDVIVYQIFEVEGKTLPYSLTIIDTPGFGDTRGAKHDDIISQRLLDLFRSNDGIHEINAVGLVMKASDNRLSDRLSYVFNSVMSLFGKNVEKNIVALITHSDGRKPKNALEALKAADIKCFRDEKNQPVYFLFDNKQTTSRDTKDSDQAAITYSWHFTNKEIGSFTKFLAESQAQTLNTTVEVLNKRIRLTACIQNLQERIKLTELKQTEIRQMQEALKMHEEEMKKNQNFTVEVDEVYKEKVDIGRQGWWKFWGKAVTCTVCEENCHYPGCTLAAKPAHCEVMKSGKCTACTNKCPASDHVKERKKYETKTRRVQKTEKDMKDKYEKSKKESQSKFTMKENLEEDMKTLITEKSQWLHEAFQHVVRLEQIALNVDSVSTDVHLNFLIEKMKEEGDTEKVQKLEEMKKRMDERTRSSQINKVQSKGAEVKSCHSYHKPEKGRRW